MVACVRAFWLLGALEFRRRMASSCTPFLRTSAFRLLTSNSLGVRPKPISFLRGEIPVAKGSRMDLTRGLILRELPLRELGVLGGSEPYSLTGYF